MQHTCIIKIENTITTMAIKGTERKGGCRIEGKNGWKNKCIRIKKSFSNKIDNLFKNRHKPGIKQKYK